MGDPPKGSGQRGLDSIPSLRKPCAMNDKAKPRFKPRLAVRALIMEEDRLLLVNAWGAEHGSDLLCAPGGGVEVGQSLTENLKREVREETGLEVEIGEMVMVNEFGDLDAGFQQVDVYFRATIVAGKLDPAWRDPEDVVVERRWVGREELAGLRYKPDSLPEAAWGSAAGIYDPLEPLLK